LNFTDSYAAFVELFKKCELISDWFNRATDAARQAFGLARARKLCNRKLKVPNREFVRQYNEIVRMKKLLACIESGARKPRVPVSPPFDRFLTFADRPLKIVEGLAPLRGLIKLEPVFDPAPFHFTIAIHDTAAFLENAGLKLRPRPALHEKSGSPPRPGIGDRDVTWPADFLFESGLLTYRTPAKGTDPPGPKTLILELKGTDFSVPFATDIEVIGQYSLAGSSVSVLDLSSSLDLLKIERFAFASAALRHIIFPDGLEEIGAAAFAGCALLGNVVFPPGLKVIREHAFFRATGFTAIIIPTNVKEILQSAFQDCTNVHKIEFVHNSSIVNIGVHAFKGTGIGDTQVEIHVDTERNIRAQNIGCRYLRQVPSSRKGT
jgi:hypothetical protein